MKRKNFTLVEILTAVAIIGILAGISLGITSYVTNRNREVQTQTTLKMLEVILEQYKTKYGSYPALNGMPQDIIKDAMFKLPLKPEENDSLVSLFQDVTYNAAGEITGIKGVNIKIDDSQVIILDGWSSPVVYVYPGVFNKTKFDLGSAGPDKLLGEDPASKFSPTKLPDLGKRSSKTGAYRAHFGKADDLTNFKRTDN